MYGYKYITGKEKGSGLPWHVRLFVTPWTVAPGSSVCGDSPGKNTGVGCHALLQATFPTQGWLKEMLCCSYSRENGERGASVLCAGSGTLETQQFAENLVRKSKPRRRRRTQGSEDPRWEPDSQIHASNSSS